MQAKMKQLGQRVAAPSGPTSRRAFGPVSHRPMDVVARSRANWRSEVENEGNGSGSNTTTTTSSSSAPRRSTSADWRAAAESSLAAASKEAPSPPPAPVSRPEPAPAPPAARGPAPQAPVQPAPPAFPPGTPDFIRKLPSLPSLPANPLGERTGEPVSMPTVDLVELMASPQRQAMAFGVLSGVSAVLGVLCCVEPESVIGIALPDAYISDLDLTFLRIVGVTLFASASVEYSLKHAAESQLLKSATYQRLMAGCAAKSAGYLAVLLANAGTLPLWNPAAWVAYVAVAAAAVGINVGVIGNTSGKGIAMPPLEFPTPANTSSWAYTACMGLYAATVLACFAPEVLFTGDPYSAISPLIKGLWAPGFFLAGVMSYVLKDAADRDRLGASTFKNLNLGIGALEYGYTVIFFSAFLSDQVEIDGASLSNLIGSFAIASFAVYTYSTAKK